MKNTTLFENLTTRDFLSNIFEIHVAQPSTTDILLTFEPYSVYIDRIVSPIWYIIGLFGNPISAKVWLGRKSLKNSSAIYLGLLAIVHMFQLITHFVFVESYTWDIPTDNKPRQENVKNLKVSDFDIQTDKSGKRYVGTSELTNKSPGIMENTTLFENLTTSNISEIPRPSTTEILLRFEPYSVYIDRIVSPIWYIIGLFGNPISAKVWLGRKSRKNSSAIYLGLLAIVHMFQLIIHFVFVELTYTWDIPTNNKPVLCETLNVLSIIPQYLAPLLVLGFTVERYIAVCHPFKKETFCTVRRAIIVIACLTALSVGFACVQADLWTYYPIYKDCFSTNEYQKFQTIWTAITEIMFS
ncbi:unnamed protein product [Mytilus edulis]|uniref:G-protein coupled receptors family 1 profile domain-containing protein n=1 Tax=Mytilus edulis TaxID=6550 RepID=A0A8S3T305_MYTED|nr:unnamed protein product [Mytilus edulis]